MKKTIQNLQNSINRNSSTKDNYECAVCKDMEWVLNPETNAAAPCRCREARTYRRILEGSGISDAFLKKTFDNFNPTHRETANAKQMAMDYVENFSDICNTEKNSIAFLGQVGSGKTHLSIAIANELMKQGIGVRYMQYREDITRLKQVVNDEISYAREINKYKNATVLLIDDLYKSATYRTRAGYETLNDADERAMFEIINYRYFKQAPMIISSELTIERLLSLDEGLNSRIIDRCEGHIMELKGMELNYRLGG